MKITFMGAGSTVFVKNVLGDSMMCEALKDAEFALYDIDADRLQESYLVIDLLNKKYNDGKARIATYSPRSMVKLTPRKTGYVISSTPSWG